MSPSNISPTRRIIRDEINARRGRRGITQTQLADALGITQPTFSKKLSGEGPLTIDELEVIAQALGVSVPELLVDSDPGGEPTIEFKNRCSSGDLLLVGD